LPEAVVLADDVLTTGSTIEACARELKRLGIKQVFSITLFIVD
jgi:predicted amidophosphoribosyltransferase